MSRPTVKQQKAPRQSPITPRTGRRIPSRRRKSASVKSVRGSRAARLPAAMSPQLATLSASVPAGEQWLHELKFDGYRLLCMIQKGSTRLITRRGKDWTQRFPAVATAAVELPVENAIIDGEVVALDDRGISSFQMLQRALKDGPTDALVFYAFDLPYMDGYDLRKATLVDRKEQLQRILTTDRSIDEGVIRYSEHIFGDGKRVLTGACRHGLEGIVSKLSDSPYESRRTKTWLKSKCHARQEFVIGGMTRPKGSRTGFGALLLGYYQRGQLMYCGRVGTGFSDALLGQLESKLTKLATSASPFSNPPTRERSRTVWVRPQLVAEIEFTEWTDDGMLRHPVFEGLREDKLPRDVRREWSSAVER
jgi:bifunctional non-homologous end joining protein LigD